MVRRHIERGAVVTALFLAACAPDLPDEDTGVAFDPDAGDAGGDEGSVGPCDGIAEDDMELGGQVALPGSVRDLAVHGDGVIACGDTLAWIDGAGSLLSSLELASPCIAAASYDATTVVMLDAAGSLHEVSAEGTTLTLQDSVALDGSPGGLAVSGGTAFVASGPTGVIAVELATLTPSSAVQVGDARDVAWTDHGLLVAAGSDGVVLLDPSTGEVRASMTTPSPALGVRGDGDDAVVLRGAQGWDWVRVGGDTLTALPQTTEGVVVDALLASGHAFVVQGHDIVRYRRDGDALTRLSSEHRPDLGTLDGGWLRAIGRVGGGFAAAGDGGVWSLTLRAPTLPPDLAVDAPSLQVFGAAGESVEALVVVRNVGGAPLRIRAVDTEGPLSAELETSNLDDSSCEGQVELAPGASTPLSVFFDTADGAPASGTLILESNDPDQPTFALPIEGNPGGPQPGDPAPDFTGLTLEGEPFRLSDYRGSVVFMKLFDFGCSTCSEEFPLIQQDLVPAYGEDVVFLGVNKGHRTAYADTIATDAALTFPVVLDLDSQAFARYRLPGQVFPLHVVIDAEGTIVLADTEPGLAVVEATLADLVSG